MLEAALTVWFVIIGVFSAGFVARHLGVWGLVCMAPIVGTAVYSLGGLLLVGFGVFGTITALLLASGVAVALTSLPRVVGRGLPPWRTLLVASGAAGAIGVTLSTVVQTLHLTRVTPDSMDYLTMAGSLERYGQMVQFLPDLLLKRQLVTGLLHTTGVLTGRGYFPSVTIILAISGIATMVWLGNRALQMYAVPGRWRWAILGSAAVFVISTNRVLYDLFYVNGHVAFAGWLLAGVGFSWYGVASGRWSLLGLSAIAFAALVPLRADAVVVAMLFILAIVASRDVPMWGRWVIVIPFTITTVVWYGVILYPYLPDTEYRLTGTATANIAVALGLVVVVAATYVPKIAIAVKISPWLMLAGIASFVAFRAHQWPWILSKSLSATGANIGGSGLWSSFWWVVPLLVGAAIIVVVVPHQRMLLFGLASYPIALLAFAYLRGSAYRVGPGDSANRMLMHVVFIAVLYVIVAAGVAYREAAKSDELVASPDCVTDNIESVSGHS